jgi:hypothetical protein
MQEPSNPVTITQKRYQCRHVHATGHQCGSPALRNEPFCYHHHTTRRPKPPAGKSRYLDATEPFELPVVEDLPSALSVAAQLLCRIASNDLDPTRAGRLLYNLQIITSIIDKASRAAAKAGAPSVPASSGRVGFVAAPTPEPLEELVDDETHGLIAPITEYVPAAGAPYLASEMRDQSAAQPTPPPREGGFTPEEKAYFKHTVQARGYEPNSEYPRPASITDADILAYTAADRRAWCLKPLKARKDRAGRLISYHEQGALHPIPAIAPQPARTTRDPQPFPPSTPPRSAVPAGKRGAFVGLRIRLKLTDRVFNDLRHLVPHNGEVEYPIRLKFHPVSTHKAEVPPMYPKIQAPVLFRRTLQSGFCLIEVRDQRAFRSRVVRTPCKALAKNLILLPHGRGDKLSLIRGPSGYVPAPIRVGPDFTLHRGREIGNSSLVLAIALIAEHPSPQSLR